MSVEPAAIYCPSGLKATEEIEPLGPTSEENKLPFLVSQILTEQSLLPVAINLPPTLKAAQVIALLWLLRTACILPEGLSQIRAVESSLIVTKYLPSGE